jgi:diguanylate cyclase (GGDEF)-like protein
VSGWLRYLLLGLAVSLGLLAVPAGPVRDSVIVAAGVCAVVAIFLGVRRHQPVRRGPWYLMAAGVALWTGGDAAWAWLVHVVGAEPFPSVADVLYLLAYPLLAAALLMLGRRRGAPWNASAMLDALIVATIAGLVLWVAYIVPTWTDPEGSLVARLVGIAYPVADVVLVSQLVHLGGVRRGRTGPIRLLALAFGVMLVADVLFQASAYSAALEDHIGLLDPLWTMIYVLWGAVAIHPSMAAVGDAPSEVDTPLTIRRVLWLAVALLALPGVVIAETAAGVPVHIAAVSWAGAALVGLVVARVVGMVRQMGEQARRLAELADTDFLTGQENARRFAERVADAVAAEDGLHGTRRGAAVLVCAVERFTEINDTLGLRTGDELLRAVGTRLALAVAEDGVVARLGGESFGVLLPGVGSGARAAQRAEDVQRAFAEPYVLPELTVSVEMAIGIAVAPSDAGTAADLLQRADVALSAARGRGDRIARYAERMENGSALTPQLMSELPNAMVENQVVVHFQPQVELGTGRVAGVEALVRWQHPEHGLLGPAAFVPAAERTGLIRSLTLHVLDRSLAQAALWRAEGRDLTVSVNLSVRNLLDPGFVGDVRRALERHRVPAGSVELEITETMAMLDPNRSVEVLGALDALGVVLSVDDYGTGYSSLAYLQRLPVQRLKIDRSFVAGVLTDPASAVIVRSTVELARHLGLSVVAEGVEDDATLLALLDMRCLAAQGFGLGRPVDALEIPALIDRIEARVPDLVLGRLPMQRVG